MNCISLLHAVQKELKHIVSNSKFLVLGGVGSIGQAVKWYYKNLKKF
jgi:hypothetical protein